MLLEDKIKEFLSRLVILEKELSKEAVFNDVSTYKQLTKEHAYLSEIKQVYDYLTKLNTDINEFTLMRDAESNDSEMFHYLEEELQQLSQKKEESFQTLLNLLVPPDPEDDCNVIMELRAGTGGDEAALFVGDCIRMYQLYAAKKGWKVDTLSCHASDVGGFKEYIMGLSGDKVKRLLQYEGGTHRVQRVPVTETQGRVHTSAITIAVLSEPEDIQEVFIDEKELRIDTYRSSGAGGQHVNVTDSAVRITHLPSGIVVSCQDERSQHKNKDKAMRILKVKILDEEKRKKAQEEALSRSSQIGSGDRSERIRTYNFPQNRVTDHRINLTLYSLDKVMQGDLDCLTESLVRHFYEFKLNH